MATLTIKQVATGLSRPVFATAPPGDMNRLFIVEQHSGRIKILNLASGTINPTPFLQISGLGTANEQGLLGLAFHPDYSQNGLFFVYFVDSGRNTNVQRYKVSANRDVADPASATTVLKFMRPFTNHNGGWIAFGPKDRMLYIASGDGGSEQDPQRLGQNLTTLMGKMLRIDVNGNDFPGDPTRHYAIPSTNPLRNQPNVRPEIWAYGLRNPWRCSFDRVTGDLYMGDVGQDRFEEIDFQPASSIGGENYGWRLREGKHDTGLEAVGNATLTDPIHEYSHNDGGIAVVGGYVYRGSQIANLQGTYLFADISGTVWSFRFVQNRVTDLTERTSELFPAGGPTSWSSFGEDAAGELFLLDLDSGTMFKITGV